MLKKLNYRSDLLNDLKNDIGYAAKYLSAALADSKEAFLVALRDVAEAQKGIGQIAGQTKLNRENLYRTLSKHGNPTLSTLSGVLDAVGLKIAVVEKDAELPAPITATPAPAQTQKVSSVRISPNVAASANDFATAWTITYVGNIAASTDIPIVGNKPSGKQLSDVPPVPLYLLAGQISEQQETTEQS